MSEGSELQPIEPHIRDVPSLDDAVVIVRGGPMTVEKLVEHAQRERHRYSCRGAAMPSISVDATSTAGLWRRSCVNDSGAESSYATTTVGALRASGYELLPTFESPHHDLLISAASREAASTLLASFGPAERNPYRRRR